MFIKLVVSRFQNVEDEEEVRRHLTNLKRYVEEFVCTNCGLVRKFVKSYMRHIKNCDGSEVSVRLNLSFYFIFHLLGQSSRFSGLL